MQMSNVTVPPSITQDACQTICDTNDCDWYTYSADNGGTCTVNKALGSPTIDTGFRVNSATPNCPPYSLLPQVYIDQGSGSPPSQETPSPTTEPACQSSCTSNPDQCQWYEYELATQKCRLNATPTGGTTMTAFRMRP